MYFVYWLFFITINAELLDKNMECSDVFDNFNNSCFIKVYRINNLTTCKENSYIIDRSLLCDNIVEHSFHEINNKCYGLVFMIYAKCKDNNCKLAKECLHAEYLRDETSINISREIVIDVMLSLLIIGTIALIIWAIIYCVKSCKT